MNGLTDRINAIMRGGVLWNAVDDADGAPMAFCLLNHTISALTGKPEEAWTLEDMRGWVTEVDDILDQWQKPGHELIAYWRPDAIFVQASRAPELRGEIAA